MDRLRPILKTIPIEGDPFCLGFWFHGRNRTPPSRLGLVLEDQGIFSKSDFVFMVQLGGCDPFAVYKGAIRTFKVYDNVGAFHLEHFGMIARHHNLVYLDITSILSPNLDRGLI